VRMESNCKEFKKPSVKDDTDESQQETIMKILGAISNKMMANMQQLQDQLVCTHEKMSREMQKMRFLNEKLGLS